MPLPDVQTNSGGARKKFHRGQNIKHNFIQIIQKIIPKKYSVLYKSYWKFVESLLKIFTVKYLDRHDL